MKGRHIAGLGLTAALAVAGTTVAVGQGTGGTLGPKAQGSATFQVRIAERDVGFHCANTNNLRRCARQARPRVGSIVGGSAGMFQGDERVGRAHFTNIVTQRGRGANSGQLFLATLVLEDGTLTVQGATVGGQSQPSSITGGTGAYAGARGFMTEQEAGGGGQGEFRINITFRFIP